MQQSKLYNFVTCLIVHFCLPPNSSTNYCAPLPVSRAKRYPQNSPSKCVGKVYFNKLLVTIFYHFQSKTKALIHIVNAHSMWISIMSFWLQNFELNWNRIIDFVILRYLHPNQYHIKELLTSLNGTTIQW